MEQEKLGRYDLAVQHFIASKDNDRVAKVVDNLMRKVLKDGTLELDKSLGSLSSQKVHNEHVEYLRLYGKFQRCRKVGRPEALWIVLVKV